MTSTIEANVPSAEDPAACLACVPDAPTEANPKAKEGNTIVKVLLEGVFYIALAACVFLAFRLTSSDGMPRSIAGYTMFTVLSESMTPVYPKGTFIISHSVPAEEISRGDDITFMDANGTVVTHRVVETSLDEQGARLFKTAGVANTAVDKDLVPESHVIGRVVWRSIIIGVV
ncbi:MAG: signal peptidase I, partial [Clostridium sp.]|nr:signal peptidase I [Clostridium sp.]